MAPGSRREVLVRGGRPGAYPVKAIPFAQFPGGDKQVNGGPVPNETVLTMRSAGRPQHASFPARTALSHPLDLRRKHVDRQRTIVFSEMTEASGKTNFMLNGMTFDPNRTDVTMKLGSVEQWTLVNENTEWHTFHIHINDFQVVSVAGKPVPYVDHQDNVALPPNSRTVILMQPTDFTGKFVFPLPRHLPRGPRHDGHRPGGARTDGRAGAALGRARRRPGDQLGGVRLALRSPGVSSLLFFCRALGIAPSRLAHLGRRRRTTPAGARALLFSGASPAGPHYFLLN